MNVKYDRSLLYGNNRRWDMTAYVENLFDVRQKTGAINQYQVYPGAPVHFRFKLGVTFLRCRNELERCGILADPNGYGFAAFSASCFLRNSSNRFSFSSKTVGL